MAIVKKRDTTLLEQKNELKEYIEKNNKKLTSELKPLKIKKKMYVTKYKEELYEAKQKSKFPIILKSFFVTTAIFLIVYYLFKSIYFNLLLSTCIFFTIADKLLNKVIENVKPHEELHKIENKIYSIKNEYASKNNAVKDDLYKIEKGFGGEYEVARLIEEKLSDKFILLNDITIRTPSGTTQIDHVLITPKRIICIETKSSEGIYYPNKNGWMWYPTRRRRYGKTSKGCLQDNPINQATYHSRKLYNFLVSKQIEYKVDAIIVLSNPYSKYKGPKDYCPVLSIHELITYLKLDDIREVVISKGESNTISKLLLQSNEEFSQQHYEKYSKKVLANI